jgi:prepilin-type N-terminal cleavage/methylation domain-containing protein/prepilin-type processing-associated H-X9-DG protein
MSANDRAAFTLVELLVVITIIGVIMGLMLPAVNAAREAGRAAVCRNNISQLSKGCLGHESKFGFLPAGGWGAAFAGDPARGSGERQPGGWLYNILPFIENQDLHDVGNNAAQNTLLMQGRLRCEFPIASFLCPSRHGRPVAQPSAVQYVNTQPPTRAAAGRSDYAANAGDGAPGISDGEQPGWGGQGYDDSYDWRKVGGTSFSNDAASRATGVVFRRSTVSMANVKDGASFTYLLGERFINPRNPTGDCNNQFSWDTGYGYDVNCWTFKPPAPDYVDFTKRPSSGGCTDDYGTIFGSAHSSGFNMALCDGSVKNVNFAINPLVHQQLGNRFDGEPTNISELFR